MKTNRRQFMGGIGALAASTFPMPAFAQAKPKVVVVGGGPGGATVAKYVAKDGGIDVSLVEPAKRFTTCFHSNLYLGGFKTWEEITHSYDKIAKAYGIKHVRQRATTIDREKKPVHFANGRSLPYDRLVLAPGIDLKFDSVPGWSEEISKKLPHAWQAGAQTQLLKRQLNALSDGATIVMIAPPNPYRCPPGPYERVSMMAHVLKAKGHKKSRIVIIDPKENFSKQGLFMEGWQKHYPGMIEWQDAKMHGGVKNVDAKSMTVKTDLAEYKAQLINVIPGADGRQDRARRRPRQCQRLLPDQSRRTCARRPTPTSMWSATPAFRATCRSRASRPTARPRWRR